MELEASRLLPAPREAVWAALNDPETLRRCIPGCDALERGEDGSLAAKVVAKVGPVSAKFAGTVSLHDLVPPESYRLAFQGQGGAAGFAKGEAWVRLEAMPDGATTMHYRSKASVGGKLAQIGSRLVDAAARKIAEEFFGNFEAKLRERVGTGAAAQVEGATAATTDAVTEDRAGAGPAARRAPEADGAGPPDRSRWIAWAVAFAIAVAIMYWLGR